VPKKFREFFKIIIDEDEVEHAPEASRRLRARSMMEGCSKTIEIT
jgi:hypothetical protein